MASQPVPAGLRLQIILSLLGLMLLAFIPLFFAVASLTRVSLQTTREAGTRALVRSIATHVDDVTREGGQGDIQGALLAHLSTDGLEAITVFDEDGSVVTSVGRTPRAVPPPEARRAVPLGVVLRGDDTGLLVTAPLLHGGIEVRLPRHGDSDKDVRFTRLIAIYVALIALTLVTFAYFSLTRLIVRPLEELVSAADRVASGKRSFDVPRGGPREVAELATSVRAMATTLIDDEAEQKKRVAELLETTKNLVSAREQLVRSERMASVGRLAAGLAHEIGNPIAALLGLIDLVESGDLPRETERDFISRVRREGERIHGIVRNLLEFARPERAFSGDEEQGEADLREVTREVLLLLQPQKAFKSIAITESIPESLPHLAIAPARLTQVLLNILMNASQAMTAGHVAIRAARSAADANTVSISIEDTGPGISKELEGKLFEPFATTKPVGSGTGLGLAVCRGIIEGVHGTIDVDPTFTLGARFRIMIPCAKANLPARSTS